jgi:hypothetical protein
LGVTQQRGFATAADVHSTFSTQCLISVKDGC